MKNNRGQITINVVVGILLLAGGLSYLFGQASLGLVLATIGLLMEAVVNWVVKLL